MATAQKKTGGNTKTVRTPENIERCEEQLLEVQAGLLESKHWHLSFRTHHYGHFHPYKIQSVHERKQPDCNKRVAFLLRC